MSQLRRYPGPQPFSEAQSRIFYGRTEAARSLYRLLKQEELVVLHAKSGIGKSSLIRAGLLPLVRSESYFLPLEVRLGAAGSSGAQAPVVTARTAIQKEITDPTAADFLDRLLPDDDSLWRTLKTYQLSQPPPATETEADPGILLIFDQFEELFTYTPAQQLDFRRQLAEALHTSVPQRYWEVLSLYEGGEAPISAAERRLLRRPLRLHLLMAIREDRIHLLGGLSDYLPLISKNWFELKTLDATEASLAIEEPAALAGDFSSAPFYYTEAAREKIIDYLSQGKTGIESTHLQIICDAIERQVEAEGTEQVTAEMLGELKEITSDYYWNKLDDIADPEQRLAARRLIEEQLIFEEAERRLSLFEGLVLNSGLQPATLRTLVDGYLLRAESDLRGGYNYELTHDSLVEPILEAKRERVTAEREAEAAEKEADQARELAAAQDRSRRARRLNLILFGLLTLAVLAIGGAVYLYRQTQELYTESQESLEKYEEAEQLREAAETANRLQRGRQYLNDAVVFLDSRDTALARAKLRALDSLNLPQLREKVAVLRRRLNNHEN